MPGLRRRSPVALTDKRSPMLRLLVDGNTHGHIYVCYHEQFRTLWRAQALGYVTDDVDQWLTDKGQEYIEKSV